jgi:hypothetical protein
MNINQIQIEVFDDNISKAKQTINLIYEASMHKRKGNIQLKNWESEFER